ncbi:PAS domain-containing hybrid sensor histidine kinase/response regulator [Phenylobacterium aquaticum]|uniref:hybrid sensor histidine kinase/response regulator n=2 Tax=Phenylobacterium aquaticum TaxID=1763816 RepID=UPI0026EFDA52|nr:PAS domain-containing hybrid sensor histidine kinase/response regulator [Phenylobacterium aquaticum]
MFEENEASRRVLEWRCGGLPGRIAQGVLLGVLAGLLISPWIAVCWVVLSNSVLVFDSRLARRLAAHPEDRGLALRSAALRTVSGVIYGAVAWLFLLDQTSLGLGAALLVGCAVALNNAVMTRGVRGYAVTLAGPAAVMVVMAPPLAVLMGHHLSWAGALYLSFGAAAYGVFLGRLAAMLAAESRTLRRAMVDLQRERDTASDAQRTASAERARWRNLFDDSPMPQLCFDASELYERLTRGTEIGGDDVELLSQKLAADPDALAVIRLTDANEAARDLIGARDFGGGSISEIFDESMLTGLALSLRDVSDDGVLPPFPTTLTRADGELAEVMVHVRAMIRGARPWSMCMVTFVDITAFQSVVRDQAEAMLAAQAASVAKSEFLAIMSHEIRTPMNGVLGMAQAMTREPLSPVQRDRLDVIRQSGEALLAILNDVLDLSKIEAGKLELETAPFDLEAVARGAHATFTSTANSKRLSFNLSIAPQARGAYLGDSARVRQVLYNLISNAVKFTAQGGVRVSILAADPGIRIEVEDTGVGIPADRLEKLFAKFVQADSSTTRQFGGTGLGLAICRELAEAMGGSITVESREGEGSRFIVELPLPRADGELCLLPDAARQDEEAAELEGEFRILAAEDNPINQLVLKTLLAQFGLTPQVVDNGELAVAAWEAEAWDLILMDVQMPVLDGPSAARAIRQRELETGRTRTPIIALTANAMTHQVDSYRTAGMDGFVAKPIEVRDLMEAISSALVARAESDAA